jgi:hypothetical protein
MEENMLISHLAYLSPKPNRPSGQLSSASDTRHLADTGRHSTSVRREPQEQTIRRLHQSANDSLRSVHRLLDNVASQHHVRLLLDHNESQELDAIKTNDQRNPAWWFKTTRDVVYGPRKYLGIGLRHLGPERECNTLLLLKHLRANTKLAHLRIGLAWFQLQSGITQPILECQRHTSIFGWFRSLDSFFHQAEIAACYIA